MQELSVKPECAWEGCRSNHSKPVGMKDAAATTARKHLHRTIAGAVSQPSMCRGGVQEPPAKQTSIQKGCRSNKAMKHVNMQNAGAISQTSLCTKRVQEQSGQANLCTGWMQEQSDHQACEQEECRIGTQASAYT